MYLYLFENFIRIEILNVLFLKHLNIKHKKICQSRFSTIKNKLLFHIRNNQKIHLSVFPILYYSPF